MHELNEERVWPRARRPRPYRWRLGVARGEVRPGRGDPAPTGGWVGGWCVGREWGVGAGV